MLNRLCNNNDLFIRIFIYLSFWSKDTERKLSNRHQIRPKFPEREIKIRSQIHVERHPEISRPNKGEKGERRRITVTHFRRVPNDSEANCPINLENLIDTWRWVDAHPVIYCATPTPHRDSRTFVLH